eukprot:scaffold13476_cov174-Amphora_coffeaeformis.AAC.2
MDCVHGRVPLRHRNHPPRAHSYNDFYYGAVVVAVAVPGRDKTIPRQHHRYTTESQSIPCRPARLGGPVESPVWLAGWTNHHRPHWWANRPWPRQWPLFVIRVIWVVPIVAIPCARPASVPSRA